MDTILFQILNYLFFVAKVTLVQILVLFSPILILALIMNIVSTRVEILGVRIFGEKIYLYIFAWLGVAIHEIGHAIFAIIFGHKITRMKLFAPQKNGNLGFVEHSYNKKNIYHNIGNFFIGIGPIIFGSIVMFFIINLFLGFNSTKYINLNFDTKLINDFSYFQLNFKELFNGILVLLELIYEKIKISVWKTAIFLFLIFSIGSSITLSKQDIYGAKKGFFFFVIVIFCFNLFTIWMGDFSLRFSYQINSYMTELYLIIVISILLNFLMIICLSIINIFTSILH